MDTREFSAHQQGYRQTQMQVDFVLQLASSIPDGNEIHCS